MNEPLFECLWEQSARAGRVVAMCNWQDQIIIACEYAVYRAWVDPYTGQWKRADVTPANPQGKEP